MTAVQRPAVPRQVPPSGGDPHSRQHPSTRRRLLTLLVVVLLIGIPAGYLVVSAEQSRDSGKDKARKAAATGLTSTWPTKVQRRIYDVPIPRHSKRVAHYETNSWDVSRLYVQFSTSDEGLDSFLRNIGSSRSTLKEGEITISDRDARTVGWKFGSGPRWAGTVNPQPEPKPEQEVTVDLENPARPRVYVVSTATP